MCFINKVCRHRHRLYSYVLQDVLVWVHLPHYCFLRLLIIIFKGPTCSKWKTNKQTKKIRDILNKCPSLQSQSEFTHTHIGCAEVSFKDWYLSISIWRRAKWDLRLKYLTNRSFNTGADIVWLRLYDPLHRQFSPFRVGEILLQLTFWNYTLYISHQLVHWSHAVHTEGKYLAFHTHFP